MIKKQLFYSNTPFVFKCYCNLSIKYYLIILYIILVMFFIFLSYYKYLASDFLSHIILFSYKIITIIILFIIGLLFPIYRLSCNIRLFLLQMHCLNDSLDFFHIIISIILHQSILFYIIHMNFINFLTINLHIISQTVIFVLFILYYHCYYHGYSYVYFHYYFYCYFHNFMFYLFHHFFNINQSTKLSRNLQIIKASILYLSIIIIHLLLKNV